MSTPAQLWDRLLQLGAVSGTLPVAVRLPWSVRLLLGLGAWLASLCALVFLVFTLSDLLEAVAVRWFLVGVSAAVAWQLAPQQASRPFAGQIGCVAACLMQALLIWALLELVQEEAMVGVALAVAGVAGMSVAVQGWRVWCGLLTLGGLLLALGSGLGAAAALLGLVLVAAAGHRALLSPAWMRTRPRIYWPVLTGVLLGVAVYSVWNPALGWTGWLWLGSVAPEVQTLRLAILSGGLGLVNAWTAWTVARRLQVPPSLAALWGVAALGVAAATWSTPWVSASTGLVLLGYAHHHRLLLFAGWAGLPLALGLHYYTVSWTLQDKGLGLLGLGLGLLLVRRVLSAPVKSAP